MWMSTQAFHNRSAVNLESSSAMAVLAAHISSTEIAALGLRAAKRNLYLDPSLERPLKKAIEVQSTGFQALQLVRGLLLSGHGYLRGPHLQSAIKSALLQLREQLRNCAKLNSPVHRFDNASINFLAGLDNNKWPNISKTVSQKIADKAIVFCVQNIPPVVVSCTPEEWESPCYLRLTPSSYKVVGWIFLSQI
ncbi:hypothetical protein RF11_03612 [Thelohanellus kitauei]|uniref:Uncharacterized protein n=1 Tax=Thelohanellus kitauei TaxID=669202 RepID=A0A0C2NGM2_THEKT|nr:hypothetical protein RF11_03612 [Thelohanellus kitauei]